MWKKLMGSRYEKVKTYLLRRPDLKRGDGASEQDINRLTAAWGDLPDDFARYLRDFGWVSFGSHELMGLGAGTPRHLNLLDQAESLWQGSGAVPRQLLPFFNSGGDWLYCLSRLHKGRPVVVWSYEEQPYDERYRDWSSWFLDYLME